MIHACRTVVTATAEGPQPRFLEPPKSEVFGKRDREPRRMLWRMLRHVHERSCMCRHDRHMCHATMHAHAHAPCGPIPVAGVSTDTFSSGNDAARVRLVSLNIPARTNNYLSCSEHGWMGSQGCAQMRPNKRMPEERGSHTMTKIESAIMITVRMI